MKTVFLPHFPDNPYQRLLMNALASAGVEASGIRGVWFITRLLAARPDVVHFHWLHPYYIGKTRLRSIAALLLFLIQWPLLRNQRARIVWTVHNIRDHERRMNRAERLVTRLVAGAATHIIVHCGTAGAQLLETYPDIDSGKLAVVPHGNYLGVYSEDISKEEARRKLGVPHEKCVVLFFGEIRAYKGIADLVAVFQGNEAPPDTLLLIAGRIHKDELRHELERTAAANENIELRPGFVPDGEIQTFMAAADAVVTPFRDVLTSGSLILALSFGKAVIAPRVGCVADLAPQTAGYFYEPNNEDGLRDALRLVSSHPAQTVTIGRKNRELAATLDWKAIGEETRRLYEARAQ